jgi:hypothetical protein
MEFFVFSTLLLLIAVVYQYIIIKTLKQDLEKTQAAIVVRAKDDKGRFVKDDPTTPQNEAYVPKASVVAKKNSGSRRTRKPKSPERD